ncbi:hypothetical protein ACFLZV_05020, partial [Candidatus Margulisiibacteriota bacterium]
MKYKIISVKIDEKKQRMNEIRTALDALGMTHYKVEQKIDEPDIQRYFLIDTIKKKIVGFFTTRIYKDQQKVFIIQFEEAMLFSSPSKSQDSIIDINKKNNGNEISAIIIFGENPRKRIHIKRKIKYADEITSGSEGNNILKDKMEHLLRKERFNAGSGRDSGREQHFYPTYEISSTESIDLTGDLDKQKKKLRKKLNQSPTKIKSKNKYILSEKTYINLDLDGKVKITYVTRYKREDIKKGLQEQFNLELTITEVDQTKRYTILKSGKLVGYFTEVLIKDKFLCVAQFFGEQKFLG